MAIVPFQKISPDTRNLGGKALGLAILANAGFPVPVGVVVTAPPSPEEFAELTLWWEQAGKPSVAVRSSAASEDSAEASFAGQNRSFLNVDSAPALAQALRDCFESTHREASEAYRQHFGATAGSMNVVVQKMVKPLFAGVFFSEDPRHSGDWILEVIPGLGEDLVSGKVTPGQFQASGQHQDLPPGFTEKMAQEVAEIGKKVAVHMKFPLDMEWAIDQDSKVIVLQARPITTLNVNENVEMIRAEFEAIRSTHDSNTTWDGQTFAEWNGLPSTFTFNLWQRAFAPEHAFGLALQDLGYQSFVGSSFSESDSLLESVMGRAYINLEKLTYLYYGPIPYEIVPKPRPHIQFAWRKISFMMIRHMPKAIFNMLKVAYNVSSRRRYWLNKSIAELNQQKLVFSRASNPDRYKDYSRKELCEILQKECDNFARSHLRWPLLLVVLTESTIQNLRLILGRLMGAAEADQKMRQWMANGIHTVTLEMTKELQAVQVDLRLQSAFLAKYGHRGPGEMELARPRWQEMGRKAFHGKALPKNIPNKELEDVENEIRSLKTFQRETVLDEWKLFRRLLEHREQWKMEILKPYAEIRLLLEELGRRVGLGSKIYDLELKEVYKLAEDLNAKDQQELELKIATRRRKAKAFRSLALPDILTLQQLEDVVENRKQPGSVGLNGEALSPGVAYGEVRFVEDANNEDPANWPADVILVAQATDPGWTPLFLRAKGIVVERGGVLSHCAIVAREMSIPAVSGILGIRDRFKDGDHIWVNGNTGQVTIEDAK